MKTSMMKREIFSNYDEKIKSLKESIEENIQQGIIPTYRVLNKTENQYFDVVRVSTKGGQRYYVYDSDETNRLKHPCHLDLTTCLIVKNSGFIIDDAQSTCNDILQLRPLNPSTFINLFDQFEEYKKLRKKNQCVQTIQNSIKAESMFVSKISDQKIDRDVYVNTMDFLKIVDDFKNEIIDSNVDDVVVYRAVRDDNTTKYFPSFFKIGDVIPQYVPFSTAMQPEFPIYIWTQPMQYSSILKIIVKGGLNGKAIPISRFSENDLQQALYNDRKSIYQSEITLSPGTFTVVNDENIVVPEKDDSSQMMIKRLLTVEYTPYSINEFENIYYTILRRAEDDDDLFDDAQEEEEEEELPEWANDVYPRNE